MVFKLRDLNSSTGKTSTFWGIPCVFNNASGINFAVRKAFPTLAPQLAVSSFGELFASGSLLAFLSLRNRCIALSFLGTAVSAVAVRA